MDNGLIHFSGFPISEGKEDIRSLNLKNNSLACCLLPEIGDLKNLTHLSLDNNSLTSLPSEIGRLKNISWIYLANNYLASLPPEIEALDKVIILDLRNNPIQFLPNILTDGSCQVSPIPNVPPMGSIRSI